MRSRRNRPTAVVATLLAGALVFGACSTAKKDVAGSGAAKSRPAATLPKKAMQCLGAGTPQAPSAKLQAYVPASVDGRQVVPSEQLGKQLAQSNKCIEALATGEIASSGAQTALSVPAGFVAAMTTTQDVNDVLATLLPVKAGPGGPITSSTKTVAGKSVQVRELDLNALMNNAQGSDPASTTPKAPVPALTIEAYAPDDHTMVFVMSSEGTQLADAIMQAAIAHAT